MKKQYRALIATLIVLCLGTLTASPVLALPSMPPIDTNYWVPDGPVYALARDDVNGNLYLGGEFTSVNPYTGHLLSLDASTALHDPSFPIFNDRVNVIIPDPNPNGGWYVGGNFTRVNGNKIQGIARLNADWSLDTNFVLLLAGNVYSMAAAQGILFVGGDFTTINSYERPRLAAINMATRLPLTWKPNPSGAVHALHINGENLFVGGDFTQISLTSRSGLAAYNNLSGTITLLDWDAGLTGSIYSLDSFTGYLFAGGSFTFNGGQNLAVLSVLDAAPYAGFSALPDNTVSVVKVTGTGIDGDARVYVGGDFQNIDLKNTPYLALYAPVDLESGYALVLDDTYQPGLDGPVRAIAEDTTTGDITIGGEFHTAMGVEVNQLARLNGSGTPDGGWIPALQAQNGNVYTLVNTGSRVIAGGGFFSAGGEKRAGLAALGPDGVLISSFAAPVNGEVWSLLLNDGRLYAGGNFTEIDSVPLQNLAALDPLSGDPEAGWQPNPNAPVRALAAHDQYIVGGGDFTNFLAWIDSTSGTVEPPHLALSGPVHSLALHNDTQLLVGGSNYAKRVNITVPPGSMTAQTLPVPALTSPVTAIVSTKREILLGSNRLDALNPQTYQPLNSFPNLNGNIYALKTWGPYRFTGGSYTHQYGNPAEPYTASLVPIWPNGKIYTPDWLPGAQSISSGTGQVHALVVSEGFVYTAGSFTRFGETDSYERPYLIVLGIQYFNGFLPFIKK